MSHFYLQTSADFDRCHASLGQNEEKYFHACSGLVVAVLSLASNTLSRPNCFMIYTLLCNGSKIEKLCSIPVYSFSVISYDDNVFHEFL